MHRLTKFLYIVLAFLLLCACGSLRKAATPPDVWLEPTPTNSYTSTMGGGGNATIEIVPSTTSLEVGQTASVYVNINDVSPIMGAECHIVFDKNKLEVIDADPRIDGVQVAHGDFLSPEFVAQNVTDNAKGTIDYAIAQMSSEDVSGSGVLSIITVRAKQPGVANIAFVDAKLAAAGGVEVPVNMVNSSIQVGEEGGAMPEPTAASEPDAGEPDLGNVCPTDGDPVLSVEMEPETIMVGETAVIRFPVNNGCDLTEAKLRLTYDPAMIAIIDGDGDLPGIQARIGDLLPDAVVTGNLVEDGIFTLEMTGTTPANQATGTLVQLTVVGLQNGETALQVTDVFLGDDTGVMYTQDIEDFTFKLE